MSAFLDETGTLITVSSSNPLPTISVSATSQIAEGVFGREWMAEYSCSAVSDKYSKIALYNPVGSGKKISFFNVIGALGEGGTVRFTAKKITSVDGMTEIPQTSANSQNIANNNQHVMKAYYANAATLSPNFVVSSIITSIVYPSLTSVMLANPLLVLNEGDGVLYELNTANKTMYIRPLFCEF